MIRVIFVDDEQNILDGLRRSLFRMRNQFEMTFATSGEEALDRFSKDPFDLIVSDMRMPSMDGATLLSEVRQQFPSTMRVILSGQSTKESVTSAIECTHQFLAKPCETPTLVAVMGLCEQLSTILPEYEARKSLAGCRHIPRSSRSIDASQQIAREGFAPASIARHASRVAPRAVQLLKILNSPFFGMASPIVSLSGDADFLPKIAIDMVARSLIIHHQFDAADDRLKELEDISLRTAELAQQTALDRTGDTVTAEWAYIGGLLSKLADFVDADCGAALSRNLSDARARRDLMARGSAYLAGLWGLPPALMWVIADLPEYILPVSDTDDPRSPDLIAARDAVRAATETTLDADTSI